MRLDLEISVKMESGLPTMILTAKKEGQTASIPYNPGMTMSEIFKQFESLTVEGARTTGSKVINGVLVPSLYDLAKAFQDPNRLQVGDIVLYVGKTDDESPDLFNDVEYRIIGREGQKFGDFAKNVVDIANAARPTEAIRLSVLLKDLQLVRKGTPPPAAAEKVFSQIITCICKEDVVLELNGDRYEGRCENCKKQHLKEREPVAA